MSNANPHDAIHLTGRTLRRAELMELLATRRGAVVIDDCTLDGEDLSRLDLRGLRFERCTFEEASFERYCWARQRHEGYVLALQRAGMQLDPDLVRVAGGTDYAFGSQAADGLLTLREAPSAVFAVSDTLAIGAIKAFRRAGRRVPDDIAVVGFDNVPLSEVFEPGLTTIAQPMRELGAAATEMLLARLSGERPPSRTLAHTLVVRESA